MKKQLLHIAATLILFLMLGAVASAQNTREMTLDIPFDFYVGQTSLPAGTYTLYRTNTNSGNGFVLRDAHRQLNVVFNTQQAPSAAVRTENKLEFRSYDHKYFLAGIWTAGNSTGYELQTTHLERELGQEAAASKRLKPEVTTATAP